MREYPVGSTVRLRDKESDAPSDGCFFDGLRRGIYDNPCRTIHCSADERKDGRNVIFIEEDEQ